jgi:MFS family permease
MAAATVRVLEVPAGRRLYYGWIVLLVAALAMVGTLPGRTQGLGLITEPLIADLGISRVRYAELNFWATLIGAAGAIGVGQLIDRLGSRTVLTLVAVALGLVVTAMSQTSSFGALAVWITLTRGFGQSALSVVSIAMVGHWFVRKIDAAMALFSVAMSIGFMMAFPLVGTLVQSWGWRGAWLTVGCGVLLLAPVSMAFVRRGPEACGLLPDGDSVRSISTRPERPEPSGAAAGYAWTEALLTPAFWVFAAGTALYGLVASGIGLFNESILAERGFDAQVYYYTLVVTAVTALAGNFVGGWLATWVPMGRLMAISLFVLTGGLGALPHVATLLHVMVWAVAMGLGGGLVMVLFFSVWPRVFGRRHLGTIQGAAQALTVLASALGPLLLAWCVEWTGSYAMMFRALAGVIGLLACAALVMPTPAAAPALAPAPPVRTVRET